MPSHPGTQAISSRTCDLLGLFVVVLLHTESPLLSSQMAKSTLHKGLKLSGRTALPHDFVEMGACDLALTRRTMSKATGDFGSKERS